MLKAVSKHVLQPFAGEQRPVFPNVSPQPCGSPQRHNSHAREREVIVLAIFKSITKSITLRRKNHTIRLNDV